jgi:hypothetical protein
LGAPGGLLWVHLEDWAVGLFPGQQVLLVARSWDTTVEFFTTVQRCTFAGGVVVSWPESLDVEVAKPSEPAVEAFSPQKLAA